MTHAALHALAGRLARLAAFGMGWPITQTLQPRFERDLIHTLNFNGIHPIWRSERKDNMSYKPVPPKSSSSGKYYTISPKSASGSKGGAFSERSSKDGKFIVRAMDGNVFESARSAANTKLREVSGKFLPASGPRKK
jgi:hypothetical protein